MAFRVLWQLSQLYRMILIRGGRIALFALNIGLALRFAFFEIISCAHPWFSFDKLGELRRSRGGRSQSDYQGLTYIPVKFEREKWRVSSFLGEKFKNTINKRDQACRKHYVTSAEPSDHWLPWDKCRKRRVPVLHKLLADARRCMLFVLHNLSKLVQSSWFCVIQLSSSIL